MNRLVIILLAAMAPALRAEDAKTISQNNDFSEIQSAKKMLSKGLPSVVIASLKELVEKYKKQPESPEAQAAATLLATAFYQSERFQEALDIAAWQGKYALPKLRLIAAESHWKLGDKKMAVSELVPLLSELQGNDKNAAILRLAGYYASKQDEKKLAGLPDLETTGAPLSLQKITIASMKESGIGSEDTSEYLAAVAFLKSGNTPRARELFEKYQKGHGPLTELATVGLAECFLLTNEGDNAEALLEQYLAEAKGKVPRLLAFEKLDEVYARNGGASTSDLRRLSEDEEYPERALEALYFYARSIMHDGFIDVARYHFQEFLKKASPENPLYVPALEDLARLLDAEGNFESTLAAIPEDLPSAKALFYRAIAAYRLGNFEEAEKDFLKAAELRNNEFSEAIENAELMKLFAKIRKKQPEDIYYEEEEVSDIPEDNITAVLLAASARNPGAGAMLENLAKQGSGKAALALAEWRFIALDIEGANDALSLLSEKELQDESAVYLRIFLADDGSSDASERIVGLSEYFLKNFPESEHLPDVAFKRAEALFRRGDYLAARQAFQDLAVNYPASPLTEQAWFYAGKAASYLMSSDALDQAVASYEEAAQIKGPLAERARFEQALIKNSLGQSGDALKLLEIVIKDSQDDELKNAAIIEKGDTLIAQSEKDPASLDQAIETWKLITENKTALSRWSNQASCKIGLALARQGKQDEALAALFQILQRSPDQDPEFFWHYKAGFEAARILEQRKAWTEAIAVYEDLSKIKGPRSEEAKARANRLRLENFIWRD
ncbi:MAG: tetratricopeptide repeat protein [Chthoniobacterales bacterium]